MRWREGRKGNFTGGKDTSHTHVPRQIRDNCDSKTTHGIKERGTKEREMHVLHRECRGEIWYSYSILLFLIQFMNLLSCGNEIYSLLDWEMF